MQSRDLGVKNEVLPDGIKKLHDLWETFSHVQRTFIQVYIAVHAWYQSIVRTQEYLEGHPLSHLKNCVVWGSQGQNCNKVWSFSLDYNDSSSCCCCIGNKRPGCWWAWSTWPRSLMLQWWWRTVPCQGICLLFQELGNCPQQFCSTIYPCHFQRNATRGPVGGGLGLGLEMVLKFDWIRSNVGINSFKCWNKMVSCV